MKRIQNDTGIYFTSKEFQGGISVRGLRLALVAPYHQEINNQFEVAWKTFQTFAHSIMVHTQVYDKYIDFALMHTTDHIFHILSIKKLVNQDGEANMPHKLASGKKPSVSNLHI